MPVLSTSQCLLCQTNAPWAFGYVWYGKGIFSSAGYLAGASTFHRQVEVGRGLTSLPHNLQDQW